MLTPENYERIAKENGLPQVEAERLPALLRVAGLLVADYVRKSRTPNAPETVTDHATAVQAAFWDVTGITPLVEGLTGGGVVASASLNGGSVSYAGADQTTAKRDQAASTLCLEARLILDMAGCTPAPVGVVG